MNRTQLTMYAAAAAVLVFLGCILPWLSFTLPPEIAAMAQGRNVKTSANGFDGDFKGAWILILSLIAGGAAALVWKKKSGVVPLTTHQLLLAGTCAYALAAVLTLTDFLRDFGGASRGLGLILTLLATIGGTACCLLALKKPDAAA